MSHNYNVNWSLRKVIKDMIKKLVSLLVVFFNPNRRIVQCKARDSELEDFNCCIRISGHDGHHITYKGRIF